MGLGNLTQTDSGSNTGSNSSGNSGSSSQYTRKHPAFSIEHYEDGSWAFKTHPNTAPLTYDSKGNLESKPPELKKFWMDSQQFQMVCRRVEKHFGEDLLEMLNNGEIESAVELINEAASITHSSEEVQHARLHRDCAVCGKEHHLRYGEYEKIGETLVCSRHNVQELKEAGVL